MNAFSSNRCLPCRLCGASAGIFNSDRKRDYFRCPECWLVFVPTEQFLSPQEERRHYDLHENSPGDPGYRKFLSRIFNPLAEKLSPGSHGLDFGSGPGPTLSLMFVEAGHKMNIYDPFYADHPQVLERQFDFITASEVVEHLHDPEKELQRLWSQLRPGGWLGLMTKRVRGRDAFRNWHYKNDPTHVCFFSLETFVWLGTQWQATLYAPDNDVVLFHKPRKSSL